MVATITKIERADETLNVEFVFNDPTGFEQRRVINVHMDASETKAQLWDRVRAEIKKIGDIYKDALAKFDDLQSKIGTTINI